MSTEVTVFCDFHLGRHRLRLDIFAVLGQVTLSAKHLGGGGEEYRGRGGWSVSVLNSKNATTQECLLHPFVATGVDSLMLVKLLKRLGMRCCLQLARYLLTWLHRFLGMSLLLQRMTWYRGNTFDSHRSL